MTKSIELCACGCGSQVPRPAAVVRGHHWRMRRPDQYFWPHVTNRNGKGCWLWTAGKFPQGYGSVNIARRSIGAHRISYELHSGPIPDGYFVCHKCDNPSCVNPDHLFLGTPRDNTRDMISKGRHGFGTPPRPTGALTGVSEGSTIRNHPGLLRQPVPSLARGVP